MLKVELSRNGFIDAMNNYNEGFCDFSYYGLSAMYDWLTFRQLEDLDNDMLMSLRTLHIVMNEANEDEAEEIEAYETAEKIAELENGKTLFIDWADLQ